MNCNRKATTQGPVAVACARGDNRGARFSLALICALGLCLAAFAAPALAGITHEYTGFSFGSFSGSNEDEASPQGLTVDQATGDVYAIDVPAETVSRFDSSGAPKDFSALGTNVLSGFEFASPQAPRSGEVAVDDSGPPSPTNGDIYVANPIARKVEVFAPSGEKIGKLSFPGSFNSPCGVAVDSNGALYVAIYGSGFSEVGLVKVFTPSANPPTTTDLAATIGGVPNPCHVAVDSQGYVYTSFYNGSVSINHLFGPVSEYQPSSFPVSGSTTYTEKGTLDPNLVGAVAVDPSTDHVYADERGDIAEYDHPGPGGTPGALIGSFGSGLLSGLSNGVAVDGSRAHHVYVSNPGAGNIAVFGPAVETHALTLKKTGPGTGMITSEPTGIACGATCAAEFQAGSKVNLTATAPPGSAFTGWSGGGCSGTNTCEVTLGADTEVSANFETIPTHTLTVAKTGSGTGTVTSKPAGIDCGATCSSLFNAGSTVTLTATAPLGSAFTGWSGGGCSGTNTCEVTLGADTEVSANFEEVPVHTLTLARTGAGEGSVSSAPAGIECGATCSAEFNQGTQIALSAKAAAVGSAFAGWTVNGNASTCPGAGTCEVMLGEDTEVSADFETVPVHALTLAKTGAGEGTITSSPAGIDCGTTCSAEFNQGTQITLTAAEAPHSIFAGWSGGGCSGTGTCEVTLGADSEVTADFEPIPKHQLSVSLVGAGEGTVTSEPAGIDCGATCSASFEEGSTITLSAKPAPHSTFAGWSGCTPIGEITAGLCEVTLGANTEVQATFEPIPQRRLGVKKTGPGAGTITSAPAGIDCGTACAANFDLNGNITLRAQAAEGSTFTGWTVNGDGSICPGIGHCEVTLGENTEVSANFALTPALVLPDHRGFEMVSPLDKNGGEINGIGGTVPNEGLPEGGIVQAAPNGEAITYLSLLPFKGSNSEPQGAPIASQYLSHRASGGWSTEDITAPMNSKTYPAAGSGAPYKAFSTDLSTGLMLNGQPPVENPPLTEDAPPRYVNYYLRDNNAGAFTEALLTTTPVEAPDKFFMELLGVTPDLRHVVVKSPATLSPEATPGANNLYEWAGGQFEPINVPPGAIDPGKTAPGFVNLGSGHNESHTISDDGSRVFWSTNSLYLRDGIGSEHPATVQVDASEGPGSSGFGQFNTASSAGSKAFFTDRNRLTADSTAGGEAAREDLYRFDLEAPEGERLTDLTVDHADASGAQVRGVLEASPDSSYLYYVAKGVLAGENNEGNSPAAGSPNLYMWHETGPGEETTTFVATLRESDDQGTSRAPTVAQDWTPSTGRRTARVTSDGAHLLFMSSKSLTGYDGADNQEVYLYDAEAGKLSCVSCNPSGAQPLGPSGFPGGTPATILGYTGTYQPRVLSADGNRVFFDSFDAMAPQDVNEAQDVYEWERDGFGTCEEEGGCISLLSGGSSPTESAFIDASSSGDDAFFVTRAKLVGQDTDVLRDLYDARVNGGFPFTPPPPPCGGEEACRSQASAPPAEQSAGSANFSGPANPKAHRKHPSKHHKKRHHKRASHKRGGAK